MTNDIFETDNLQVTAFIGIAGEACIQIGLKGDATYEQLNELKTRELIDALTKRVNREEGYRATD